MVGEVRRWEVFTFLECYVRFPFKRWWVARRLGRRFLFEWFVEIQETGGTVALALSKRFGGLPFERVRIVRVIV